MSARQRSTASRGLGTAEGDDDEGVYQEQHPVTLGSHQTSVGRSQVHCTPRWILERLGPFDLDPCAADPRPWDCAAENWTTDGLGTPWHGRVWLNPPFDRYEVGRWIACLAQHGNGTALLHARTEAGWFEPIWESSTAILFMADRIKFCRPDGSEQPANSGAPPVLVAFGDADAEKLEQSGVAGSLVTRWNWQPRACAQLRSHAHA